MQQKDNSEEEKTLEKEDVDEETNGRVEIATEFPFEEDIFEQLNKSRIHKIRTERRDITYEGTREQDIIINTIQLKMGQEKDPEIQRWIQQEDLTRLRWMEGLVY